jgi:hypothetical protein
VIESAGAPIVAEESVAFSGFLSSSQARSRKGAATADVTSTVRTSDRDIERFRMNSGLPLRGIF